MDYSRTTAGSSKQAMKTVETPEQLLDVFKAAALSVTKLYKTSALAESRARADGYQDCLEDLLGFLDKENMGLCDGEGWGIRRWATERLDGRDSALQSTESEDETDKAAERTASPEVTRRSAEPQQIAAQGRAESPASSTQSRADEPTHFVVPSQDSFTFQSAHPYPNIATLDLSDGRPHHDTSAFPTRATKARLNGPGTGRTLRTSGHLGRGAGTKRRINFDDFFGGCFGGKDPSNPSGKRGRHA
ncbi:hypothetical protein ISF_01980 [Cordyceps fumosorosea ARSEF 2679]|uniref:Uncharacterized protein n=1 Tax=Cordyceps fumosorosea (strain ARSEF 2679) TaxID=1081104 RepID=A0A162MVX7_CORFA|nr:hypothetical protein ISF_01980 [Cordyceps fumosorosea ARSEF 2679]OAA71429.1 hypothetical protein ISF_01980 [Cordyceps fumosorosea ARSEF 2679]